MEAGTEICQVTTLFDKLERANFQGRDCCELHVKFPEYLPPILLTAGAEECIARAAAAMRRCAGAGDALFASAYYEDHRDPAQCCVVLVLALKRKNEANFCVESSWLDAVGNITEELLAHSIALSINASECDLNFEFRLAVHAKSSQRIQHRNTILLVEDDGFVRHSSREVLEMYGYRVEECGSAEEAEKVFARIHETVAVVVSDVSLPGRDGRDLARTLHRTLPSLPILLVSGYTTPPLENAAQNLYYLPKPYNSRKLVEAVEGCLVTHHTRAALESRALKPASEGATASC